MSSSNAGAPAPLQNQTLSRHAIASAFQMLEKAFTDAGHIKMKLLDICPKEDPEQICATRLLESLAGLRSVLEAHCCAHREAVNTFHCIMDQKMNEVACLKAECEALQNQHACKSAEVELLKHENDVRKEIIQVYEGYSECRKMKGLECDADNEPMSP